ncbi:MAG: cupin domain-containing protein [Balneolaceae bacterium]|nr:cupin domain-containing protein [Balneolaceae bacterium]MBO6546345.1 cupin domain-containing protein [Balneolaceae bacterium]MBO6648704.1 cupin domain-containing protein [Balneolaceae bacterium]
MYTYRIIKLVLLIIILPVGLFAQEETVKVEVLSKTSSSWDGAEIEAYPSGKPEITISRITMPVGFELPVHKHTTPLGGMILEGELTVTKENGESKVFKAGDPIVEVMNTWHAGKNTGEVPTVLIAFYIGEQDTPLSINQ